jgi:hypothetical protein
MENMSENRMRKPVMIGLVAILLLAALVIGFLTGTNTSRNGGEDDVSGSSITPPTWEKGMYWVYTFNTPDSGFLTSRLAVAEVESENYMVGVDKRIDAQRHAVLNFNPMIGRIGKEDLALYEKDQALTLFKFPLEVSSNWSFSLFNIDDFQARVVSIERDPSSGNGSLMANIEAIAPSGEALKYSYDSSAKWIGSLALERSGEILLEMNMVLYGTNYAGDLYFIRGVDLFDEEYSSARGSPELQFYDTFLDQGHPNWGPFTDLIYFFQVETGSNTVGVLTIHDHSSNNRLRRTFQSNTAENSLGLIPSDAGEWGVTVTLLGQSDLRLRIAGGIEYHWTV